MKIQVYTSCSINYLPKARVLAESIAKHSPNTSLVLLLNDDIPEWLDLAAEPFDAIWTPAYLGYSAAWIFEHNVMELCTAVKGRALAKLIDESDADIYLYLDPDCYVFHPLQVFDEYLGNSSIGLVPHILQPADSDVGVQLTEISVAEHGTYNLGHLVVRPDDNGRKLAAWWAARLDKYCFDDKDRGLFTDQRWMDMVPAMFEGVKILRVPNIDVASWNLYGRSITQERANDETAFVIDGYPMVTYHFSGTGPTGVHRAVREIFDPCNAATAEIERIYEDAIARHGQKELEKWRFGFDFFDNGSLITAEMRKLYRRSRDLQNVFPDPFETAGNSYHRWLQTQRPGLVDGIRLSLYSASAAFSELFDTTYYLQKYPDARKAIEDKVVKNALDHYIKLGSSLMYNPNEFFIADYYYSTAKAYEKYQLIENKGTIKGTLLWHYLTTGLENSLEPIPYFDSKWYLATYKDIAEANRLGSVTCPISHFFHSGAKEGRTPCAKFDPKVFLATNDEAQALVATGQVRGAMGAFLSLTFDPIIN